jgi:hypothetical protein
MSKKVTCPFEGFEEISLTFPDQREWKVRHSEMFWRAYRDAGEKATLNTALLHGCVAVCEKIEGLPADIPLDEWPLQVFLWIINEVYYGGLDKATNPPKNLLSPAPPTATGNGTNPPPTT